MAPRSLRPQRGLAAAAIVVVLILVALALVLGRGYFTGEARLDQRATTDASLRRASDALVAFATQNGRLPCPARGDASDGTEQPAGPTATCTYPDGVVPWVTLGLRREDAVDAWGGKISYRVYASGAPGDGFTRDSGVNARNCSTEVAVGDSSQVVTDCGTSPVHADHPIHFLRAMADATKLRGLYVNDRGTTVGGLAFVLLSHGPSERGAFGAESGTRNAPPSSASELRNTQAPSSPPWNSPFVIDAVSDAAVPPDSTSHFDDIVSYMSESDLLSRAKLGARAWPAPQLTADAATIQALVPGFNPSFTQNTGQTSLQFGRVTVTATANSVTQNIGFRERDGTGGIGVISTSGWVTTGGSISSSNDEVLILSAGAGSTFQKADIALNEFQTVTFWPFARERVELSFWLTPQFPIGAPPVLVQSATVSSWHWLSHPSLCLLESLPGTIFDRLEIRPLDRSDGGSSSLTLAAIKACSNDVDTCEATVADTSAVRCPNRPPSAATTAATEVGATTATFHGTVRDNGAAITATRFQYGLTTSYGSTVSATPFATDGSSTATPVTANLTGLACDTTYYFRTQAVNSGGTTVANDSSFRTAACP